MEQKSNTAIIKKKSEKGPDSNGQRKKKKLRGPMHLIRVALYMLRSKSGKSKSAQVDVASKWKKFLGSIRSLHFEDNRSLPQHIDSKKAVEDQPSAEEVAEQIIEHFEGNNSPPYSSPHMSEASSSCDPSSRYASALSLVDLDPQGSEEGYNEENDCFYDDMYADEMIDVKAEQFIAQFYEEMRLQREAYENPVDKQTI